MKNKLLITSVLALSVSFVSLQKLASKKNESIPKYSLGLPFAVGSGGVNCDSIFQNAIANEPLPGTYANHALDHVHDQLYRFNKMESADIEMVFCRLVNVMGMNPDLSNLPQSLSRTVGAHTFTLDVTAPSETFATTFGYDAKAVVKYDGTAFVTLWWTGNSDSSKGYLIQGANPLSPGDSHLKYAQWDRTGTTQVVKIFATVFNSSYLSNPNYPNPIDPAKPGGDRAAFGRATYDTVSKSIYTQGVEIRQDKNNSNAFACYKMQISGIIAGTLSAYRPALGVPDSASDTNVDGSHVDGVTGLVDSVSTVDGSGTPVAAPASLPQPFDYSCSDINSAGGSGVFAGNTVNFNLDPSSVFPN